MASGKRIALNVAATYGVDCERRPVAVGAGKGVERGRTGARDMTVSVVVPCRRRDASTEKLLSDIRRQASAGGAELDLVVVEGLSPVGRARNEALNRVRGDYLTWVDADDEILNGWWQSIVGALESSPDVVVFGWRDERLERDCLPGGQVQDAQDLLREVLRDEAQHSYLWDKVIRRDFWKGIRFDERSLIMEDFDVLPHVLVRASRVAVIDKILYRYRFNRQGLSRKPDSEQLKVQLEVRWQRFSDWAETPFAAEAIAPFVGVCGASFSRVKAKAERKLLHRYARRLLRHPLLTVFCPLPCRSFKLKALLAACGF